VSKTNRETKKILVALRNILGYDTTMQTNELRERLASAFQAEVQPGRMRLGAHGDSRLDSASAYELADIAVGVVARRAVQARASEIVREVERRCGGRFSPTDRGAVAEVVAEIVEESAEVRLKVDPVAEFAAGRCPDGGACHHDCHAKIRDQEVATCWRVHPGACEPLSIASWGRWWPADVLKRHRPS
jgi:hypothetical protein